jgi:hypothetical protein
MPAQLFEIVCALCTCRFTCVELKEDELLCEICGHSLDDDHSGSIIIVEQEAATP